MNTCIFFGVIPIKKILARVHCEWIIIPIGKLLFLRSVFQTVNCTARILETACFIHRLYRNVYNISYYFAVFVFLSYAIIFIYLFQKKTWVFSQLVSCK